MDPTTRVIEAAGLVLELLERNEIGGKHVAELREALAAYEKAGDPLDAEMGRWQKAIYDLLCERCPGAEIDGAGSDSDELDFTLAEIGQALAYWQDKVHDLEQSQRGDARQVIQEWIDAYPLDIWPKPTMEQVKHAVTVLAAAGLSFDRFCANAIRHAATRMLEQLEEQAHPPAPGPLAPPAVAQVSREWKLGDGRLPEEEAAPSGNDKSEIRALKRRKETKS